MSCLSFHRETNLKVRQALPVTSELGADISSLAEFDGKCFEWTEEKSEILW
jgi:hypothetical protein